MKIRNSIKNFKLSIILFLSIAVFFLITEGVSFFCEIFELIKNLNWTYFGISGVGNYIAAISFAFPYYIIIKKKNIKIEFSKFMNLVNDFVYFDCLGNDPYIFLNSKLGFNEKKSSETFLKEMKDGYKAQKVAYFKSKIKE